MDATAVNHTLNFGEVLRQDFQLSNNCVPITGATVNCTIKRLSDSKYWTGAIWDTITVLALTEYASVTQKGYYSYSLTPPSSADTIVVSIYYNDGTNVYYETHVWRIQAVPVPSDMALNSTVAKASVLGTPSAGTVASQVEAAGSAASAAAGYAQTAATQAGYVSAKLPSKAYLTGTANSDGDIQQNESTGDFNTAQLANFTTLTATLKGWIKKLMENMRYTKRGSIQ